MQALFVNQLAKDMQTLRSGDEENRLRERMRLLEREQQDIESKIAAQLQELLEFVRQNGSPETWGPMLTNLLERNVNVREKIETNRQQLHITRARISYLQDRLKQLPQQTQLSETSAHNPVLALSAGETF